MYPCVLWNLTFILGKKTGVVTNTRITHATPANAYANSAERNWESHSGNDCEDIAKQLVKGETGSKLNVSFFRNYNFVIYSFFILHNKDVLFFESLFL